MCNVAVGLQTRQFRATSTARSGLPELTLAPIEEIGKGTWIRGFRYDHLWSLVLTKEREDRSYPRRLCELVQACLEFAPKDRPGPRVLHLHRAIEHDFRGSMTPLVEQPLRTPIKPGTFTLTKAQSLILKTVAWLDPLRGTLLECLVPRRHT